MFILFGMLACDTKLNQVVKNLPDNAGGTKDTNMIPGVQGSPGEGNDNPVFLPGRSHGQRNLVGYSPWDHRD